MPAIGGLLCQHNFGIAGQLEVPRAVAFIEQVHPPDFNSIRADGNPGAHGNTIIRAQELDLVGVKQDFLLIVQHTQRLAGGGPQRTVFTILDINPCSPPIETGVNLPAG